MIEKRQHSRVTISAEVNLSSEDNFYAGAARDISVGGLFVETEFGFPIGAEITVLLRLPNKVLSLRAEVMWAVAKGTKTTGLGLRFVDLPSTAKNEIEAFMTQRQPIDFSVEDEVAKPPPLPDSARRK
ncbi:MAG TPA: PilZ domain-containing protein [Polyangiaceae bacterium]